jgi:hypothetical protein
LHTVPHDSGGGGGVPLPLTLSVSQAFGRGFEPPLRIVTRCFLLLKFAVLLVLFAISAEMTALSLFNFLFFQTGHYAV